MYLVNDAIGLIFLLCERNKALIDTSNYSTMFLYSGSVVLNGRRIFEFTSRYSNMYIAL